MNKYKTIFFSLLSVFAFLIFSNSASAIGYFTLPFGWTASSAASYTSLFDHTSPEYGSDASAGFTRYDGQKWTSDVSKSTCTSGTNCYNGHNGIDYPMSNGTNVLAAADGTVKVASWDNPNDFTEGYGFRVRLWHSGADMSTFYAHMASGSLSIVNQSKKRGDHIGESSNTGDVYPPGGGYHLHFSVFNNDSSTTANSIDPYGWSGTGSDPWTINEGNLWITKSPIYSGDRHLDHTPQFTASSPFADSDACSVTDHAIEWSNVSVGASISALGLWLDKTNSPTTDLKIRVYKSATPESGALMAVSSISNASNLATTPNINTEHIFEFSKPVSISAGNNYSFVIDAVTPHSTNNIVNQAKQSDAGNGTDRWAFITGGCGGWTEWTNEDWAYRFYKRK